MNAMKPASAAARQRSGGVTAYPNRYPKTSRATGIASAAATAATDT